MSISNTIDFERFLIPKNLYDPIYTILNFREFLHDSSKMVVFLVESRHQFEIPLSSRDVKTSDSSQKLILQTKKNNLLLEISTTLNIIGFVLLVVFSILLISVTTIIAARNQYPTSCLK